MCGNEYIAAPDPNQVLFKWKLKEPIYMTFLSRVLSTNFLCLLLIVTACSDDAIDSDEEARRAYLGLDTSIEKSLTLGFDGFNSASSANISPQQTTGDSSGTLTITGQVDQGASSNKGMRLSVGMVDYSDGVITIDVEGEQIEVNLTYDTSEVQLEQPFLELSLRNIPDGTFTGELTGNYQIQGDIDGNVELKLTMDFMKSTSFYRQLLLQSEDV